MQNRKQKLMYVYIFVLINKMKNRRENIKKKKIKSFIVIDLRHLSFLFIV